MQLANSATVCSSTVTVANARSEARGQTEFLPARFCRDSMLLFYSPTAVSLPRGLFTSYEPDPFLEPSTISRYAGRARNVVSRWSSHRRDGRSAKAAHKPRCICIGLHCTYSTAQYCRMLSLCMRCAFYARPEPCAPIFSPQCR